MKESKAEKDSIIDYKSKKLSTQIKGTERLPDLEFSKRCYRSKIMESVLKKGKISIKHMSKKLEKEHDYIQELTKQLALEGFLEIEGEDVKIKNERFVKQKQAIK